MSADLVPVVMRNDPVALLEQGKQLLEQAVMIDQTLHIRALASAAASYARQAKLGREAENAAAELRVRAERRTGELLRETAATGQRAVRGGSDNGSLPTLRDLGIGAKQSERHQALAAIPEPEFEAAVAEVKESGGRLSAPAVRSMAVHYSSATDQWATPQDFFDALDAEFHFDLDVCADAANAKCKEYFDERDNGLERLWTGTCWMNPPYGGEIPKWVAKAHESSKGDATVVCLLPARTDTGWWWDHCRYAEIRFIRGRLKFGGGENSAPFPNAVVIFGRPEKVVWWEWKS